VGRTTHILRGCSAVRWLLASALLLLCATTTTTVTNAAPREGGESAPDAELKVLPQPRRLVDTQPGSGYQGAGQALTGLTEPHCFHIAGQVGVPSTATAVMATLTAVGYSVNGWITLFAAGDEIPDTSNLNFDVDQYATASLTLVPLGDDGQVCAVGQAGTHLLLDVVGFLAPPPAASGLTCASAATLESLLTCIVDQSGMRDRTGVYVIPSEAARAEAKLAARAMLSGICTSAVLGDALAPSYRLTRFTDASTGRRYCVLLEVGDRDGNGKVDQGWGTFIVADDATRELNIAIAHPLDDARTQDEGLGVFSATRSRSFLMAGARRDLGGQRSCPGDPEPCDASDVAHNVDTLFYAVTEELAAFYGSTDWTQLQFHGNRSCPRSDAHLSYGARLPLTGSDRLSVLKAQLRERHQDWLVTLFGEPGVACDLHGTTNVEGRLLNADPASSIRRFIHIEQWMDEQRTDRRDARNWIPAISATWP
jgi:hypothetical protein